MSNRVRLVIGVAIVAWGLYVLLNSREDRPGDAVQSPVASTAATPPPLPPPPATPTLPPPIPPGDAPPPPAPEPADTSDAAQAQVVADIDDLQIVVRDFRASLGGNPVGNNAEIVKQLMGDNLKQVKLTLPAGTTLNGEGELCDRWGTPLFFHQVSRDQMEIRSAGPDRKMWTGDDRQR